MSHIFKPDLEVGASPVYDFKDMVQFKVGVEETICDHRVRLDSHTGYIPSDHWRGRVQTTFIGRGC